MQTSRIREISAIEMCGWGSRWYFIRWSMLAVSFFQFCKTQLVPGGYSGFSYSLVFFFFQETDNEKFIGDSIIGTYLSYMGSETRSKEDWSRMERGNLQGFTVERSSHP
jgi:hypothetical protein